MDDSQATGDIAHARCSEGWLTSLCSAPQLFRDIVDFVDAQRFSPSVDRNSRREGDEASWL